MKNVKLYDIHGESAVENYLTLITPDKEYFYWDSYRFKKYSKDDIVFWVNRSAREALYTRLDSINIKPSFDNGKNLISDLGYNVFANAKDPTQFENFYRFKIIERVEIPKDWNYSNLVPFNGQTMAIILYEPNFTEPEKKIQKIEDLRRIFTRGNSYEELKTYMELLQASKIIPAIVTAIKHDTILSYINEAGFIHQLSADKLKELIEFQPSEAENFYQQLLDQFTGKKHSFIDFLNSYGLGTDQYKMLRLIGEVTAYCDMNAANKREFNQYPDKRVLALSFVRQTNWVENLIRYKETACDINSINSPSIRNAISYLLNPEKELTMLAENHRKMVARYLLKTAYDKGSFVSDLLRFFEPYEINPANSLNLTRIICEILYRFPDVKKLWFEKIEGLVVCDSTGWLEKEIDNLQHHSHFVLWWDKLPTGGAGTLKLLKEQIDENKYFYIFYTRDQKAFYRSRIVNFSLPENYPSQKWEAIDDLAMFKKDFSEYIDNLPDGKIKRARIVFLADEIIKLNTPIGYEHFEFYKEYQPPTQNNMQPYAEMKAEIDAAVIEEIVIPEKEIRSIQPTLNTLDFEDEYRRILMAVKTKPFVLLAGISGTGKSRQVRTLAYKTCALKELQNETPGNFLLVQVKPNLNQGYRVSLNILSHLSSSFW